MEKPLVFISHITEEREVALAFKNLIEEAFIGLFEVFVSSDRESLPLGTNWLDTIGTALKKSKIVFVFCSPKSVTRPWISVESGAAWGLEIPLVGIIHAGMTFEELPPPLGAMQSIQAENPDNIDDALRTLARALGATRPGNCNTAEFISIVRSFRENYTKWEIISRTIHDLEQMIIEPQARLHALLLRLANGERPFRSYEGVVIRNGMAFGIGSPIGDATGLVIQLKGEENSRWSELISVLEGYEMLRVRPLVAGRDVFNGYSGSYTTVQVEPMINLQEIMVSPKLKVIR